MTQEDNRSLRQKWIEFWGRQTEPPLIEFDETSILTKPANFDVGLLGGCYLPLRAMTVAIITYPNGQKKFFNEGGFIDLPNGVYTIQYVDLRDRTLTFMVTDTTRDGPKVSLNVSINYKVSDFFEITNVAKPLDALFAACEAAVRKFITTHRYHQIIGEPDNEQVISDDEIARSIKDQVANNQACRAFWLMDVVIKERYGDPTISTLKHEDLVQEKKSAIEREGLRQQQEIAEEQQTLALIEAETARLLQESQATGEANRSEILEEARRLSVELETLPKLPEWQNAQAMRRLDVLEKALEALIRAQTIAGFPRDTDDRQLIQNVLGTLAESSKNLPQIPPEHTRPANELKSTIINLVSPKKNKGK
ncbi:MAG: SPFH domain-containing protein [Chloroflexota bacterium]